MGVRALGGAALALGLLLAPAAAADDFTVVQANVGNANVPGCRDQVFRLCQRPVERRAAQALHGIRPDLAAFEEVLPPELCVRAPSDNPEDLCSGPLDPPSQVSRLVDPPSQACDTRFHWDCLAAAGPLRLERLSTRPVQPGCSDPGATLSTATARLRGWPITVAVAHPSSADPACRARQIRDLFSSLPASGPSLILGDFNLDPFRDDDESVREWKAWVPSRFRQLNDSTPTSFPCGSSQLDPSGESLDAPAATCAGQQPSKTTDHVLVRGLEGHCEVRRVDGGGGMDHRAQVCRVHAGAEVAPAVGVRRRRCTLAARFSPRPPHLIGVRFRLGKRYVVDRRAPYQLRRDRRHRHAGRLVLRPLLANGDGPRQTFRVRGCRLRRPR